MRPSPARPLGAYERAMYLTGERFAFNLVASVHLGGALSAGVLKAALESLQRRHPLLRCAIRRRRGRPVFELDRDRAPIPVRPVQRLGSDTWKGEVEAELVRAFDAGQAPLVRCTHLSGGQESGRHDLLFTFQHSLVDAAAVLTCLRQTLEAACRPGGSEEGRKGGPGAGPWASAIPPSADERLPAAQRGIRVLWPSGRFLVRQAADEIAYRRRTRGRRSAPGEGPFSCRILPLVFGESETAALVRSTRRRRVSVSSALNAALLVALVRHRFRGAASPHRYFTFPLLRSYLRPPVPDHVVAGYSSVLRFTVPVGPDTGLWTLAAAIHQQVDVAAKRGEKFLAARWSALFMNGVLSQRAWRMGTAALSYAGAVELAAEGAPFEVEGLHAFVSNFPLGPEYTAQARVFRRRLWLDILYLDTDMNETEAMAVAGEMRGLLAESTARAGEATA